MMAKHTPGPWIVTSNGKEVQSVEDKMTGNVSKMAVCGYLVGKPAGIADANARLIAKSPDMAELLCEVLFSHMQADDLDDRIEACLTAALGPENMPQKRNQRETK